MSELLSLTTRKTPLVLRVKSQDLTNPRLLPKNLNRSLLNRVTLLLPLCLQGARGRGMKSKILAPPSLRSLLSKKRHPRKRVPSTLTTTQAPLARKLLHCHYLFRCSFFLFAYSFVCVNSGEEEEKEETEVHGAALTSTSQTLVLSEDRRAAEESSPPPQQDMETSPPTASPRAPSPKRARIEVGDSHAIVAGGFLDCCYGRCESSFP